MILKGFDKFTDDVELVSYDELINDSALKNQYLNWLNDFEVVRPILSDELMKQKGLDFIEESFERFTKESAQGFFIKYKPENLFVGTIKLDKINKKNNSGELGIMIGEKQLWGKKIGEKAYLILLKYAFENIGLNRVWGGTDEHNHSMQKLFLKTGFVQEGRLRKINYFNGKYSDNFHYSILKEDYER